MKAKLGSGARFKAGVNKIVKSEHYSKKRAGAIMADAGRKRYGKTNFQKMASAGRMRRARGG